MVITILNLLIMKKNIFTALCMTTVLFLTSCGGSNDEPSLPESSKTAEIYYEAELIYSEEDKQIEDYADHYYMEISYTEGKANVAEVPDASSLELKQVKTQSDFTSDKFTVKTGAILWLSGNVFPNSTDLVSLMPEKPDVELRLYVDNKLVKTARSNTYTLINSVYYPSGMMDFN